MMNRAYSLLTVKSATEDADGMTIEGVASTPNTDRVGDVVEPTGARFKTPLPLFMHHESRSYVGRVEWAQARKDGIPFRAFLPFVKEAGKLKERVDEAIHSLKYGLLGAVSIGFKADPDGVEYLKGGGARFKSWEWLELSLVPIPANADARITSIKSFFDSNGAHKGASSAVPVVLSPRNQGAPSSTPKGNAMNFTATESIRAMEAERAEKAAQLATIMQKATGEGRTLNVEEQTRYDETRDQVKQVDAHLARLKEFETLQSGASNPVPQPQGAPQPVRTGGIQFQKSNEPPHITVARILRCQVMSKGSPYLAAQIAENMYRDDPRVAQHFKAVVVAGSTVSGTWGADYMTTDGGPFAEFLEYLRPLTILGRVPGLRRVPFYAPVGIQTGAGAGYWVGEGKAKPLTSLDADKTSLAPLTVANILVLTKKLFKYAGLNMDLHIRDELSKALIGRMDTDFIDPTKTASAGVSPASITNGVAAPNSAGATADDVRADIKTILDALTKPLTGLVFITDVTTAIGIMMMRNGLGQREFPDVTQNGGTIEGFPLIASDYVPSVSAGSILVGVKAPEILVADEGGFSIDLSEDASLQMDDAPTQSSVATVTATSVVSMFQTNSIAFRVERDINWAVARSGAVAMVDTVNYG